MKLTTAACIAVALLLALLVSTAHADTIRVGAYTQPGDFTLVREGDEILAPVLLGLKNAGFGFVVRGRTLILSSPAGREIGLTLDVKKATVDGERIPLDASPRVVDQRWYLPVNGLADALGMTVSWSKETQQLVLLPRLSVLKVDNVDDTVTVVLGAEVPIRYTSGQLVEPPRVFLDIENLILVERTRKLDVNTGTLLAVRAAARSVTDPGVRCVMDLTTAATPEIVAADNDCTLKVRFPKATQVKPPAPKALLENIQIQRTSLKSVTVTLSLSSTATATSEMRNRGRLLAVKLYGVGRKIEQLPSIPEDELVSGIALRSLGGAQDVQELQIALKQSTQHMLSASGKTIRIVLGELSLNGMKIVIDPGHGGFLPGVVGRGGTLEKDVNLDIGLRLERLLQDAGVKVYMTRSEDCELCPVQNDRGGLDSAKKRAELYMRPRLANSIGADLFISIHNNSGGERREKRGTEVYYWTPQSKLLAQTIHEAVLNACDTRRSIVSGAHNFVVIRESKMPSCLVEVAYVSNKEDEALLATPEFRQKAAQGIFNGIQRYILSGGPLGCPPPPPQGLSENPTQTEPVFAADDGTE